MSGSDELEVTLRTIGSLEEVDCAAWNALAGVSRSGDASGTPYNPFVSHAFLSALEESGSVGRRTGWMPQHVVVETADGDVLGAAPTYLKVHSQGEYVFDHGWADAFERAGGDYYPKLLTAVPFTPATGPRLLVREGSQAAGVRGALVQGLAALAEGNGLSSAHVNFANETDAAALEEAGWLPRLDRQFHWRNRDYESYDDFLAGLASRKRKSLKRERREALSNGIVIEWLSGEAITEAAWDAFYAFYMDTGSRKWGRPYLTRGFFSLVGETMGDDVVLIMARREGRWIAGALNFVGGDTIYGRHWGCVEHHPFLHFEVCYHQAIDYAIAHGLGSVEAGAQGEHKLARGYTPVLTRSFHHIVNPSFRRAVADYLKHEREEVMLYADALDGYAPFRRGERTDRGEGRFAIRHREVEEQE